MNLHSTPTPPRFLAGKLVRLTASAAIGLTPVLLLVTPQPAAAIDVRFSFDGITGIIRNLAENTANQRTTPPVIVEINGPALFAGRPVTGVYDYSLTGSQGSGFYTGTTALSTNDRGIANVFTQLSWSGGLLLSGGEIAYLQFGGLPTCCGLPSISQGPNQGYFGVGFWPGPNGGFTADTATQGEITWQLVEEVPGPLPVLGAAAAFGYSRKLRKRIRGSRSVANTAPNA
jgi:hypothetical protein